MGQGDPGGQHQAGMTRTRWHAAPLGGKREIQNLLHVPSPKTWQNLILRTPPDLWVTQPLLGMTPLWRIGLAFRRKTSGPRWTGRARHGLPSLWQERSS